jgi:hypothetical protein
MIGRENSLNGFLMIMVLTVDDRQQIFFAHQRLKKLFLKKYTETPGAN